MKLTTKGRYAVTALLDIAAQDAGIPISIEALSKRQGISKAYLERLAVVMRTKGLLKSQRGAKGGYQLGKPAENITVGDIVEAVGELMDSRRCKGQGNCHKGVMCSTHHLWEALNHHIYDFLHSITLSTLVTTPSLVNSFAKHRAITHLKFN